jgi:hypothetical protein
MQMVHHSSFENSYNPNKDHILDIVGEWHNQIQYIEKKKTFQHISIIVMLF